MPDRNNRTNAIDTPTLFDDVLKTSQSASQLGPLRIFRVPQIPLDSEGRNGDLAIIDDTAFTDTELASGKEPTQVGLCQKVPAMVPDGENSATSTANGATLVAADQFSIDKTTIGAPVIVTLPLGSVFVQQAAEAVNNAAIPGISATFTNTFNKGSVANPYAFPGDSITINGTPVVVTKGGNLNYIVATINNSGIPFISSQDKQGVLLVTHLDGGPVVVAGPNVGTIFGVGTITGGKLTIVNDDGYQVDLVDVTGTPLATMGFPTTIAQSPMVLGGTWNCFSTSAIQVQNAGTTVGSFNIFNFLGTGISSITDAGGGQVDINISGGAGATQNLWETIQGDAGNATAAIPTDTLNILGGTGISTSVVGKTLTVTNTGVLPPGLSITIINSQPMLTLEDTTRGNKILSIGEQTLPFGENALGHNDWLRIGGNATDADSGFIADFDGTVVYATAHCENTQGNSKQIHLWIDNTDVLPVTGIGTLVAPPGLEDTFVNTTLNINFNRGQKIRLQAQGIASGNILDTVVKLTLKWRG